MNNKHDPVFQDCVVAEHLQQLLSRCPGACHETNIQNGTNLFILKVWTAEAACKRCLKSMYFLSKMSVW